MNNLELMPQTVTITAEMMFQRILQLEADLSNAIALIVDPLYNVDTPQVFEDLYKAHFERINEVMKVDPAALYTSDKLQDIPRYTKILYSLIQMQQRLAPPPPGQIQIIKPN